MELETRTNMGIELKVTYAHGDDRWPILVSATYEGCDVVRFYSPDGGTDIGVQRAGAKDDLVRKMHDNLLLYEARLRESGYTFVPHDWERLMVEAGVPAKAVD